MEAYYEYGMLINEKCNHKISTALISRPSRKQKLFNPSFIQAKLEFFFSWIIEMTWSNQSST